MALISSHLSTPLPWEVPSLSDVVLGCVTSFGQLENGKCDLGKGLKRACALRLASSCCREPSGHYRKQLGPVCKMVKLMWSLPS